MPHAMHMLIMYCERNTDSVRRVSSRKLEAAAATAAAATAGAAVAAALSTAAGAVHRGAARRRCAAHLLDLREDELMLVLLDRHGLDGRRDRRGRIEQRGLARLADLDDLLVILQLDLDPYEEHRAVEQTLRDAVEAADIEQNLRIIQVPLLRVGNDQRRDEHARLHELGERHATLLFKVAKFPLRGRGRAVRLAPIGRPGLLRRRSRRRSHTVCIDSGLIDSPVADLFGSTDRLFSATFTDRRNL